jgi:hypothetical protein
MSFYGVREDDRGRGRGIENPVEKGFMTRSLVFVRWIMELAHEHFASVHPLVSQPEDLASHADRF